MVNKERLINSFIKMVEIDSVSYKEGTFKDYLKHEFSSRGLKAEEDNAAELVGGNAGNLLVRIPGTVDKDPLLFAAHMDTVEPGEGIRAVIDGEIIKSKGDTILGSDDKAAVAAMLEAYDVLKENNLEHPPLEFLFTVGEEQGLMGSKAFDFTKLRARKAYVLDAGGDPGSIIISSPCQNEIEYVVYGKAAHAGMAPENGINAIKIAALALAQMPCGRIDEETTCNFGIIEGGKARNIVADICRIKGEARSLNRNKLDKITRELEETFKTAVEKAGGKAGVEVKFLYPEIKLDKEAEVVKLAEQAVKNIGLKLELVGTGGGSDASIINGNGIPCVNLGIGMRFVHTNDEYIKIDDLVADARLVLAIIAEAVKF